MSDISAGMSALNWFGNIFSLLYFLTPSFYVYKFYKKSFNLEEIPLLLLFSILLNCLFWLLNAFSSDNLKDWVPLLLSNFTGLIANLVLMFLYLYSFFEGKPNHTKKFVGYGLFVTNLILEISYLMFRYIILKEKTKDEKKATFHSIGLTATFINVFMYLSPLQNILKLIKTKSYKMLPIITLIFGFLTTMIFIFKGIIGYNYYDGKKDETGKRNEAETIVSNGISFFLICCQIALWTYFFLSNLMERQKEGKFHDEYVDDIQKENLVNNQNDENLETNNNSGEKKEEKATEE